RPPRQALLSARVEGQSRPSPRAHLDSHRLMPSSRYERAARSAGYRSIAGVDEAGRGALFGPVFAAAVVLDPLRQIRGLDDSKQLEPERREVLAVRIRERALAWSVAGA